MIAKIKTIASLLISRLASAQFWRGVFLGLVKFPPKAFRWTLHFSAFFVLLIFFIFGKLFFVLQRVPFLGKALAKKDSLLPAGLRQSIDKFLSRLETTKKSEVKRSYLISLGYKNLLAKKTRTLVTMLGMSVGVGIIVYLLSLGYGIERLIISQVASLDELKMIDVTTGENTVLALNDNVFSRIKAMKNVDNVMPVSSFVGRVEYNNARSDVLVYSSSNDYLKSLGLRLIKGKLFAKNESYYGFKGKAVAGAVTGVGRFNDPVMPGRVIVSPSPDAQVYVYSSCSKSSTILGSLSRMEGGYKAQVVWGENYDHRFSTVPMIFDNERKIYLAEWALGDFPLFYETGDGRFLPKLDKHGRHEWSQGCIPKNEVIVHDKLPSVGEVLSESTSSAELQAELSSPVASQAAESIFANAVVSSSAGGLEVISLAADGESKKQAQKKIEFEGQHSREAVVSTAFLSIFNIPLDKAIGTKISTAFILSKLQVPGIDGKALTENLDYQIIGVLEDDSIPYIYVPLEDIKKLKIDNFSQVKVVMSDKSLLEDARHEIEVMGFRTFSTLDTVAEIESLFGNLRLVLGLLGLVALGVASLGMFNTLTVSLLERTREIGGMKTMGMIAEEVQDLFLSEAMILGLAGGLGGLLFGFLAGYLTSFIVSLLAFSNGQGFLNLTYIPPFLILFIIVSSFIVGLITGLYPAKRAKKISALNALRYE